MNVIVIIAGTFTYILRNKLTIKKYLPYNFTEFFTQTVMSFSIYLQGIKQRRQTKDKAKMSLKQDNKNILSLLLECFLWITYQHNFMFKKLPLQLHESVVPWVSGFY